MYAVGADEADDEGPHGAQHQAGVLEGIGHGQDTRAEGGLEEVNQGSRISESYIIC